MRVPVLATALCLFALAGCEQSYSTTRTVTEEGGEVIERSVEVQIGGPRKPSPAQKSAATPDQAPAAGETAAPAAADAPVASES